MIARPRPQITLALGTFALMAALAPAPQDSPKAKAGGLKELAEARAKVCQRMVDYYREALLNAPPKPNRDPDDLYESSYQPIEIWSRRLVEAKLDAAAGPEERIAVLAAELGRLKKIDGEIRPVADQNPSLKILADQLEFIRLEVEFRHAKEMAGR